MIAQQDRLVEVIGNARVSHARAVEQIPDGEIADLDWEGRTIDQAIAAAVDAYLLSVAPKGET